MIEMNKNLVSRWSVSTVDSTLAGDPRQGSEMGYTNFPEKRGSYHKLRPGVASTNHPYDRVISFINGYMPIRTASRAGQANRVRSRPSRTDRPNIPGDEKAVYETITPINLSDVQLVDIVRPENSAKQPQSPLPRDDRPAAIGPNVHPTPEHKKHTRLLSFDDHNGIRMNAGIRLDAGLSDLQERSPAYGGQKDIPKADSGSVPAPTAPASEKLGMPDRPPSPASMAGSVRSCPPRIEESRALAHGSDELVGGIAAAVKSASSLDVRTSVVAPQINRLERHPLERPKPVLPPDRRPKAIGLGIHPMPEDEGHAHLPNRVGRERSEVEIGPAPGPAVPAIETPKNSARLKKASDRFEKACRNGVSFVRNQWRKHVKPRSGPGAPEPA